MSFKISLSSSMVSESKDSNFEWGGKYNDFKETHVAIQLLVNLSSNYLFIHSPITAHLFIFSCIRWSSTHWFILPVILPLLSLLFLLTTFSPSSCLPSLSYVCQIFLVLKKSQVFKLFWTNDFGKTKWFWWNRRKP